MHRPQQLTGSQSRSAISYPFTASLPGHPSFPQRLRALLCEHLAERALGFAQLVRLVDSRLDDLFDLRWRGGGELFAHLTAHGMQAHMCLERRR